MPRTAWFLNLDAEEELAAPERWHRSPRLWRATAAARTQAFERLAAPGDILLELGEHVPAQVRGQAWCPTLSALEELTRAGAALPDAPPMEVLRRVNDRRFLQMLGLAHPEGRLFESAEEYARGTRDCVTPLRHKTLFGAAGRGQRVVGPASATASDREWVRARFAAGPLWVEPELEVLAEFAVHGLVERDGRVSVGAACEQRTTAQGAWQTTRAGHGDVLPGPARPVAQAAAERAGAGLAAAGYFGPFGLDGLVHSGGVHPATDLNARFTMGWRAPGGRSDP